jgi:hypothetical protein
MGHTVELRSRMGTIRKKPYHQVILDGRQVGTVFVGDNGGFDFAPVSFRVEIGPPPYGVVFSSRNAAAQALVDYMLTKH